MSMLLSREQARRELGFSLPTVDALITRGELETVRQGRRVFIPRSSLERWIRSRATLATHEEGATA